MDYRFATTERRYPITPSVVNLLSLSEDVDPGGSVVIILASGSGVRGFDPGRGRWVFSGRKNPEYDFLQKGSKSVGPVS